MQKTNEMLQRPFNMFFKESYYAACLTSIYGSAITSNCQQMVDINVVFLQKVIILVFILAERPLSGVM